jgi:hypothetical protein
MTWKERCAVSESQSALWRRLGLSRESGRRRGSAGPEPGTLRRRVLTPGPLGEALWSPTYARFGLLLVLPYERPRC